MVEAALMQETIWFDQPKFEEAEKLYQLHLLGGTPCQKNGPKPTPTDLTAVRPNRPQAEAQQGGGSALVSEIAKARENIKKSLDVSTHSSSSDLCSDSRVASLEKENKDLKKLITDLTNKLSKLETRVSKLEGSPTASTTTTDVPPAQTKEVEDDDDDDEDDLDLFGSDDEDDEETEKIKQERLQQYANKKSKKPALVAKSGIVLDVKPWDDETDLKEIERKVRAISADGLLWGGSKLIPVAYGIKKLQISCVVEDDKIGTDFLEEEIIAFEDLVQSVDIAAFNKI